MEGREKSRIAWPEYFRCLSYRFFDSKLTIAHFSDSQTVTLAVLDRGYFLEYYGNRLVDIFILSFCLL
jgi:hypothetical protein